MITDWRRLFKRVGGGLEKAFWSESVGNFSSATPASTWSSSLADAHPGPCSKISAQAAAGMTYSVSAREKIRLRAMMYSDVLRMPATKSLAS